MPVPADLLVYGVINPLCLVLAYRNILEIGFKVNVFLWSLPAMTANYLNLQARLEGYALAIGTSMLWVLFFGCAYLEASIHAWAEGKSRGRG